jgi:chromosome segregation protein
MFLKSVRMAGFKSFADPTILEFEPGVNTIVGPNGSGKSNIADALSWVLGSQAPSSLRGGSMEDVIFAGSDERPRLGVAEVELIFDNSSRILPLDLNEVSIARTTDRSGASEYRINGAACRLLDVTELLSDTGIGRSIHTVVGQGQLDAILQARAEDRRGFIEEAAQIGKYRRRKDRSLRKIERVDDNLTRLGDVLAELRRSLRPLKRQASAAAEYSDLLGEQRSLRQRLAATEVRRLASDTSGDPAEEAQRARLLSEELESVRARLEGASAERRDLIDGAESVRSVYQRMIRSVDRLGALARLADERAEKMSVRLAAETEEGYRERIRLLEVDRQRIASKLAQQRTEADGALAAERAAAETLAAARAAREEAEHRVARARADETVADQALVRSEGMVAAGESTLGSVEARVQAIVERRAIAQRELADAGSAVDAAETDIRSLEAELDGRTEAAAAAEVRLEEARERAEQLKDQLNLAQAGAAAAEARLNALEDVARLFEDRPDVVARLRSLLEDAAERADLARASHDEANGVVQAADAEVEERWLEVVAHDDELRRLDALVSGAAERLAGCRRHREQREIELAAIDEELARARESLAAAQTAGAEARAALPAHRAELRSARAERESAEAAHVAARKKESDALATCTAAQMDARGAEERALAAQLRAEETETGIADAEAALAGLEGLRASLRGAVERAQEVSRLAAAAVDRGSRWSRRAEEAVKSAQGAAETGERKLVGLRGRERELAEHLQEVVRRRNLAEIKRAENSARIDAIAERAMDEWGMLRADLERLEVLEDPDEIAARERVEQLERQIRRLGPVNPRAAEEYAELSEREDFLVGQIEDLKASRRDLLKVVRDIDDTIVEVFGAAFATVAREFEEVFSRLFPGGSGRLKLTEPDDLLASGIEVEARPPGKNVRKLSLLSGGERSLVALAFLFAIFRAKPSPFYLLDEVEAALDDINLQRFLGLIAELEEHAQVLIVTHQKRTMEAADVLYGVSMNKEGVSRVVAKRMEEAAPRA